MSGSNSFLAILFGFFTFPLESLWDFLQYFAVFFIVLFVCAGAFITFFGRSYPKITIGTFAFLTGLITILAFLYGFIFPSSQSRLIYYLRFCTNFARTLIILVLAVGGGAVLAYFSTRFVKFGCICIGVWGGISVSYLLNSLLFAHSKSPEVPELVLLGCAILGGVLPVIGQNYTLIIASAFAGASLLMSGLSLLIGDKSNYYTFYKGSDQAAAKPNFAFYLLVISRIVLTVFGIYIQYQTYKREEKLKDIKEDDENKTSYIPLEDH